MSDIVHAIFDAFKGPGGLAEATGIAPQTVCDWRTKGKPEIPPWRRPAVLEAARRLSVTLPSDCISYLQSSERAAREAA